jgi:nucleotidyltransferase/DNA polymerase involved in DNA repair
LRINGLAMDSLPTSWERVRTGDGWNETFPKRITGMYVFDYYQAQFGATDTWRFEALCRDGITRTLEVKGKKWWPSKAERKTEKQEEDRKKTPPFSPKSIPSAKRLKRTHAWIQWWGWATILRK